MRYLATLEAGKVNRSLDKLEMPPSVSVCGLSFASPFFNRTIFIVLLSIVNINNGYYTILLCKTVAHDEGFLDSWWFLYNL